VAVAILLNSLKKPPECNKLHRFMSTLEKIFWEDPFPPHTLSPSAPQPSTPHLFLCNSITGPVMKTRLDDDVMLARLLQGKGTALVARFK